MRRAFLCVLVIGMPCACSPPHRATSDGSMLPPPDASLCGNGVLDLGEECDQGALNGTPQGTCTKQCFPRGQPSPYMYPPFRSLQALPLLVRAATRFGGDAHLAFAFTDFGDAGLQYAFFEPDGSLRQVLSLKVHSPAAAVAGLTGVAATTTGPVWIEQAVPGVGGPWLLWATFDSNDVPTIHDIPFPFADATRPELIQVPGGFRPLLVDQSSVGNHDLIVAELIGHDDGTIDAPVTRLPSVGSVRGRMVAPSVMLDDEIDAWQGPPGRGQVYRIVQFYDDVLTFQTIDVRLATLDDWASTYGPYQISEYAHGMWPYRVVGGTGWVEGCAWDENQMGLHANLTHPHPMAVISETGDVYTWQFDHSPSSGELVQPFAHVQLGSLVNFPWGTFSPFQPLPLWVLQPDGTQVYLTDGDNCDPTSVALLPYVVLDLPLWTTAWRGLEPGGDGVATDTTIHRLP